MEWLNRFKSKAALDRTAEEELYNLAYREVESGRRRPGLWAKAIAKSSGSEKKAKSLYIEFLVQKYKDDSHIQQEILKQTLNEHVRAQKEAANKGATKQKTYSYNKSSESDADPEQKDEMWKPAISGDAVLWVVIGFVLLVFILAVVFDT